MDGWIKSAMDFVSFTNWMGVMLYWVPMSVCAYGYTVRTWINYQKDVEARESAKTYYPTDTIGTLIGRALATIVPVCNLWAASFDVAPKMFSSFFAWVGRVFNTPLVPKRKSE